MSSLIPLNPDIVLDAAQRRALERLTDLCARIRRPARRSWFRLTRTPAVRGVYLVGAVGRGKTMLMDHFVAAVGNAAYRAHFHRFMRDVHARLTDYTQQSTSDPLKRIAQDYAKRIRVLCLDDLWVSDITDAMLLGTLFQALHDAGVTLVITSNTVADNLYLNGLQRARFLPTIALLKDITDTISVDGGTDYRLRALNEGSLLYCGELADELLIQRYHAMTAHDAEDRTALECQGRTIAVMAHHSDALLIRFHDLCVDARSALDYIELADRFEWIAVVGLPVLGDDQLDATRRFTAFIDEIYDRHRTLALSSPVAPWDCYRGVRLAHEWQRTQSRLHEMLQGRRSPG